MLAAVLSALPAADAVLAPWHDVLLASAGAAATLAGLIIVAMSVNIGEIISIPSMPGRAGAAIGSLVQVVVVSIAALVPGQPLFAIGIETLVFTAIATAFHADSTVRQLRQAGTQYRARAIQNTMLTVAQVVPFAVGGILLCLGSGAGLYWVLAGCALVFIGSILNAWVLLVEIRR